MFWQGLNIGMLLFHVTARILIMQLKMLISLMLVVQLKQLRSINLIL